MLVSGVFFTANHEDEETLRILDDVIVLAVHANPGGAGLRFALPRDTSL
jgi:hypothetical protein